MLLVLDGLNEQDAAVWPAWFSSALDSVRRDLPGVGIVVTDANGEEGGHRSVADRLGSAAEVVVGGAPEVAAPAGLASPTMIEIEDFDDEEVVRRLATSGRGTGEPN